MSADAITRVRCKIGEHELEVEGTATFVVEQMERWARLAGLASISIAQAEGRNEPPRPSLPAFDVGSAPKLADLFTVDQGKKLVVPRVFTAGRQRNPNAALLILYGYRQFFPETAMVPSALFNAALVASGCRVARLDKVLERHVEAGLIRRAGTRVRGLYALTLPGEQRAAAAIREFYVPK